ncbi:DnaJ domain-containing protein [Nostoc sp. UHCC 0702]|nr:DnaJ domain-containing protein [Nostoc sp. UHCC 0702]
MANDFYQILEVSTQSSANDIKKAYYGKIREYPPEKYPEQVKRINEAYKTLSDPEAKKSYDALQLHGEQIGELLRLSEDKITKEKWSEAIRLLKRILVLMPDQNSVRNRLGLCYIYNQEWENAVKTYLKLTQKSPEVPLYWINFAEVYNEQADSLSDEDSRRGQLYQNARNYFEKAIQLQQYNSEGYLKIAEIYLKEGRYSKAIAWAECAINADGQVDFQDFDALFFIASVHFYSGELQEVEQTAQRINAVLPNNEDARSYASYKFAIFGTTLYKSAMFTPCLSFLASAKRLDPNNEDIKKFHDHVDNLVSAFQTMENLNDDSYIIGGYKVLASLFLSQYLDIEHSDEEIKTLYSQSLNNIFSFPNSFIIVSASRLKSNYYAVYKLNREFYDEIEQKAQEINNTYSSSSNSPSILENAINFLGKLFD